MLQGFVHISNVYNSIILKFCLGIVVSNTYSVVFLFFFVLCTIICQIFPSVFPGVYMNKKKNLKQFVNYVNLLI